MSAAELPHAVFVVYVRGGADFGNSIPLQNMAENDVKISLMNSSRSSCADKVAPRLGIELT